VNIQFAYPWILWLLPIALLPWWRTGLVPVNLPSLDLLPRDVLSKFLAFALRLAGSILILVLLGAIAGPYIAEQTVERTGKGAQIILLLDRSRSMDQPFYNKDSPNIPALAQPMYKTESKGGVARRVLSEFVAARKNDRFGMLVFSTNPIEVLPLTDKQPMVQAAIEAGGVGRGLAETDIGAGLMQAMSYFTEQPYTGSRIIILISDGGGGLPTSIQNRVESLLARNKVSLYWIYLRTHNSVGLFDSVEEDSLAPQQTLHRFFSKIEVPYRVYTAENPDDLKRAIDDVGRVQNMPILYQDVIPREDLAHHLYRLATGLLVLLLLARLFEVRIWR